jgi:6-phosphofructokinase
MVAINNLNRIEIEGLVVCGENDSLADVHYLLIMK